MRRLWFFKLFVLVFLLLVNVPGIYAADRPASDVSLYAEPLPDDPLKVTVHRLENGLTVYLSENHQTPRITANIVIRAGGRHDPQDSTGMAHYLEHMLFKGSERMGTLDWPAEKVHLDSIRDLYEKLFECSDGEARSNIIRSIDEANIKSSEFAVPNELDRLFKELGCTGVNAYTANDKTVYMVDFPKNRAEAWAAIESERFLHPVFRLFQTELETVYEEKNRGMDDPGRVIHEAYQAALFPEHPYGVSILGTVEHLKNPSLKKMYGFYDRYYRPGNMAIVLAGDFDSGTMLALLKEHFLAWKPKENQMPEPRAVKPLSGVSRVEVKCEAEEMVLVGWQTVKNGHPDQDALELMDMLVDNSVAGILNLRLNQMQRVKSSGSHPSFLNEAGAWLLWGQPKDGQDLDEVESLLMQVVSALKNGEFEQADIDAIITDMEVRRKKDFESNDNRARTMAESFASFEDWAREVGHLDRLRKLTREDVLRVAKKYIGEDRAVVRRVKGKQDLPAISKPEFTKVDIDPSRKSLFYSQIMAMPAVEIEPKWIEEGADYEARSGKWGRIAAAKNPVHDLFSLSFIYPMGSRNQKELPYACKLWNLSGAGDIDAEAFRKKLYGLGSSMSFSVGEQNCTVTLSGLEKNFEETLALMYRRFSEPNLQTDDLSKLIAVEMANRRDSKTNPDMQQKALREWALRGDESSFLNDISNEELAALDEGRLRDLLKSVTGYRADIAYTGLRDVDSVAACLDGRRRYARGYRYRPLRYTAQKDNRILILDRDMVQAKIGMFTADEQWNPDHWADYNIYSQYVGGGMSSLLFQEVREARALAYVVWGFYRYGARKKDQNIVEGVLGTQADKAVEGTALVRSILSGPGIEPNRFQGVKDSLEQMFRASPLTYAQVPDAVILWRNAGITGGDPRRKRMEAVQSYTMENMKKFADRFRDKPWTIYMLGSTKRIDLKALDGIGRVEVVSLDDLYAY